VIAVCNRGDQVCAEIGADTIEIPSTNELLLPILEIIPLQLFAYHIAVLRGCDVDQPRNLAKSVTVE
jgi:glucosamine--fructose-6-phosphate aminotransferase (isomerizing)